MSAAVRWLAPDLAAGPRAAAEAVADVPVPRPPSR